MVINAEVEQQLRKHLEQLPIEQQRRVLAYAQRLTGEKIQGVAGKRLLQFAGFMPREELDQMSMAIEKDCERVNPDEW
jgi:hypothetical protein